MSETKTYEVPAMHCGHCEAAVKKELSAVPGVRRVNVDLDTKQVSVEGESLDDGALRRAIDGAGYEAVA